MEIRGLPQGAVTPVRGAGDRQQMLAARALLVALALAGGTLTISSADAASCSL